MILRPWISRMRLVLFTALLASACARPAQDPHGPPPINARADSAREAVETGLLPAVMLAGRSVPSWSIVERMARYAVPGLSIAVIDRGELAWAAGYGVTGRGNEQHVSPETLFQAASISKAVAAAGALRLVQEGRVRLDEDLSRRVERWKIPRGDNAGAAPVTLRRLLSHSAGVNLHGFPGYSRGERLPSLIQILEGSPPANSPAIFIQEPPGHRYRYSGGGYQIVELVMEEITGRPFATLMKELVLEPAGMRNSTFVQPLPDTLVPRAARGHAFDGTPIPGGWHDYPEGAAAGLWSTPTDIGRFAIELSRAFRGGSTRLLDPAIARSMLTRQVSDMGLGVGVHDSGERLHFDHSGWTRGTRTYMIAYPDAGQGVVVMANADGGHELIAEVVRAVARVYGWPHFAPDGRETTTVHPDTLASLAGRYSVDGASFDLAVSADKDHLIMTTPRGSRYTFYPSEENVFFALEDGSEMTVAVGGDGGHLLRFWGFTAARIP